MSRERRLDRARQAVARRAGRPRRWWGRLRTLVDRWRGSDETVAAPVDLGSDPVNVVPGPAVDPAPDPATETTAVDLGSDPVNVVPDLVDVAPDPAVERPDRRPEPVAPVDSAAGSPEAPADEGRNEPAVVPVLTSVVYVPLSAPPDDGSSPDEPDDQEPAGSPGAETTEVPDGQPEVPDEADPETGLASADEPPVDVEREPVPDPEPVPEPLPEPVVDEVGPGVLSEAESDALADEGATVDVVDEELGLDEDAIDALPLHDREADDVEAEIGADDEEGRGHGDDERGALTNSGLDRSPDEAVVAAVVMPFLVEVVDAGPEDQDVTPADLDGDDGPVVEVADDARTPDERGGDYGPVVEVADDARTPDERGGDAVATGVAPVSAVPATVEGDEPAISAAPVSQPTEEVTPVELAPAAHDLGPTPTPMTDDGDRGTDPSGQLFDEAEPAADLEATITDPAAGRLPTMADLDWLNSQLDEIDASLARMDARPALRPPTPTPGPSEPGPGPHSG